MIDFQFFELKNGLQVYFHHGPGTPIAAVNLTYNVGARDENPNQTGFAHLFEHLMFGGSKNIPSYDTPLQLVGGENNAFTSNDITNYYITLPKESIETALWLESDRMLELAFTPKSLEIQKQVVIEEFKQRYLNQPYGDAYLKLRPLAYKVHPYRWATIGKEIAHIEEANMHAVKDFFYRFYRPNNAILSVAGNIDQNKLLDLVEKWFGNIPQGEKNRNIYSVEPHQTESRRLEIEADVPADAIYIAFHIVPRMHKDYQGLDLISDILSRGNASRFYLELIKEKSLFSDISAYVTGDKDAGLFIISGQINEGVAVSDAESAIWEIINNIQDQLVLDEELNKVINKVISASEYANTNVLNKAMGIGIGANLGNPNLINEEVLTYQKVNKDQIKELSKKYLQRANSSTLIYNRKN